MKKNKFLQHLIYLILLLGFTKCNNDGNSSKRTKSKDSTIIHIKEIAGKPLKDVGRILGKIESKQKIKGNPCQKSNCERVVFQNGKFDILIKDDKVRQVVILSIGDLTNKKNAIVSLGLNYQPPSLMNLGTEMRWSNVDGIYEINFYKNYVVISVTAPDEK